MTDIEKRYVEQGYRLPDGYTWEIVAACRAQYNTPDHAVPVAVVPGVCAGWAVPMIDGKFLEWR